MGRFLKVLTKVSMRKEKIWGYWLMGMLISIKSLGQTMQFVTSSRPVDTSTQTSKETFVVKNPHLLPLFGETTKSSEQIEFEIQFLNDCDQNFPSRKEASAFFAERGWDYLREGDLDTACYRFNLAYLLDNQNADTYWGLGVVCFQQGQFTDAERMLRKGIDIDSTNVGLLVDLATVDLIHYKQTQEKWELIEAEQILARAERLDSNYANTYLKKSVLEFHKGNYNTAWEYFHRTYALDAELLDYEFMKELSSHQCDPKGIFSPRQ